MKKNNEDSLKIQDMLKKAFKNLAPVNPKQLAKLQKDLAKLRPLRDKLEIKARAVPGFSGIVIRNKKIIIFACDADSNKDLTKIAKRYRNVIIEQIHRKKGVQKKVFRKRDKPC